MTGSWAKSNPRSTRGRAARLFHLLDHERHHWRAGAVIAPAAENAVVIGEMAEHIAHLDRVGGAGLRDGGEIDRDAVIAAGGKPIGVVAEARLEHRIAPMMVEFDLGIVDAGDEIARDLAGKRIFDEIAAEGELALEIELGGLL